MVATHFMASGRSPDMDVRPVVPAGGSPLAGPDGPVVAGGPVGPCETPSPSSEEIQDPLEHAVLIRADPAGQHAAVGTPSECCPVGPAGPYVAGGPVGPDVSLKVPEPLEHAVLIHADPAGQHAAVGTLSPSDCYPAGPAGPYVAGGPVGPDDCNKFWNHSSIWFWTMLTRLDNMLIFRILWNR